MSEASDGHVAFDGAFNDGRTAASRPVRVTPGPAGLKIVDDAGAWVATWPNAEVRLVDTDGKTGSVRLRLAGGTDARLLLTDRNALAAIVAHAPQLKPRHGLSRALIISIAGLAGTAALAAVLWFGLPWAARGIAATIPVAWERALGDRFYDVLERVIPLIGKSKATACTNADGAAVLARLVSRLSPSPPPYDFRVAVLDVPVPNAFALPGGRMVIFRGLLDFAEGPDELAGVLAHEMAHVIHRDGTTAMVHQLGLQGVLGLFMGGGTTVGVGEALLAFSHSREAEAMADAAAVGLLRDAGIDIGGMAKFFQRIVQEHGDMPGEWQFLSTHPSSESRVRFFAEAGAATGSPAMSPADWQSLRAICNS